MGGRCHIGSRRTTVGAGVAATALLALASGPTPAAAQQAPLDVPLGDGTSLVVEREPFRVSVRDAEGRESVATVPADTDPSAPPVRPPGVDGPQPLEPLGAVGGFPAMGFVAGVQTGLTYPLPFFTGNRLFGAEAGVLVSVVGVEAVEPTADGARLRLRTDRPEAGPATLVVRRREGGGAQLSLAPPPDLRGVVSSTFTLASPDGEGLYGLGARKDAFDQRGRLRNVWTEEQNASDERFEPVVGDDPTGTTGPDYTFPNGAQAAYYVQAALHGSRGWAAWVDESQLSRVDLAASRADAVRWGVASPTLTLSLAGGGVERASRSYTNAVGRAPAPPRYVYENWVDVINEGEGEAAPNGSGFRGGQRVKDELEEIDRQRRRHDLPIGVLGVEGWHQVPDGPRYFADLRRRGYRLSAYWNPFTSPGTPAYEEAVREGVLIRDPTGRPYEFVNNRGGRASVVDFSHPRSFPYWRRQLDRSKALGFEAFMHDFGEFVTEGMRFHSGLPPEVEHNRYPVRFHAAAAAALAEQAAEDPSFRPWFYVRSGFNGVSRSTGGVFPGDETTDFAEASGLPSVIPAMLNLALQGSPTFTTDVGGYLDLTSPRTTPELFTRWTQLASLTAVNRIHDSTFGGSVYPWELGDTTLDAYRRYARLKERLIPLVDRETKAAAADGSIGPVRPLVLEDPSPEARSIDDQWLLGDDLLVAPIVRRGATSRSVYLPAGGRWMQMTVGEDGRLVPAGPALDGGRRVTARGPIEDIPLFVREGARGLPVATDANARTCRPSTPFKRVVVRPRGAGARLAFVRRRVRPVDVDVFLQSSGRRVAGERLVARFRDRDGSVGWDGRATVRGRRVVDGVYMVRYRMRLPGRTSAVRRVVLERRGGRFRVRPDHYLRESCGLLTALKLGRPVVGGPVGRPLDVAFRVKLRPRVTVTVTRGGRTVRRFAATVRASGRTHRLRVPASALPRGDVRVTVRATQDGRTTRAVVVARRL